MRPPTPCALLVLLMGSVRRRSAGMRQDPQGRSAVEAGIRLREGARCLVSASGGERKSIVPLERKVCELCPATVVLVRAGH